MSAANVTFETLDYEPAAAGEEVRFGFTCPKRTGSECAGLLIAGRTAAKGGLGGVAQWIWDGNREAPTFSPSINCKGCWHGYIRAGRCVAGDGADEPEPPAAVEG